jgi:hypothetical protein
MQQSMILGNLDPSGAASTWRAYYSKKMDRIFTSASVASEFRTFGNMIQDNHSFNYKRQCVTGVRGAPFDQQTDQEYWQNKQLLPNINRPLGGGPRNAAIINEGVYNINPIAGTNDFSGNVISRATGLNPTNYSLVNTDDIQDRVRANAVPSNDPLSAQFAMRLQPGNQIDPNNVEGDAMVNTFQNKQSIARAAKSQVIDENLVSADSSVTDPTFEAGLLNKAFNFKDRSHIETMPEGRRLSIMVNNWVESLIRNQKRAARGHNQADDQAAEGEEEEEDLNPQAQPAIGGAGGGGDGGPPPGAGGGGAGGGGEGGDEGGGMGGGGGARIRSGQSVKPLPTPRGNPTGSGGRSRSGSTFTDASGMFVNNPDDLSVKSPMQVNTFRSKGSVSQNASELAGNLNRQPFKNQMGNIKQAIDNASHGNYTAVDPIREMAASINVGHNLVEIAKMEAHSVPEISNVPGQAKSTTVMSSKSAKAAYKSEGFQPQVGDEVIVRRRTADDMDWSDGTTEFFDESMRGDPNVIIEPPPGFGRPEYKSSGQAGSSNFLDVLTFCNSSPNSVLNAMGAGLEVLREANEKTQNNAVEALINTLDDIKKRTEIAEMEAAYQFRAYGNAPAANQVVAIAMQNSDEMVQDTYDAMARGSFKARSAESDELKFSPYETSSVTSTLPSRPPSVVRSKSRKKSVTKVRSETPGRNAPGVVTMKTDTAQSDSERRNINRGSGQPLNLDQPISFSEDEGVVGHKTLPILTNPKPLRTGSPAVGKAKSRSSSPSLASLREKHNNREPVRVHRVEGDQLVVNSITAEHIVKTHEEFDRGRLQDVPGIEGIKFTGAQRQNPFYQAGSNMAQNPHDLTPVSSNISTTVSLQPQSNTFSAFDDQRKVFNSLLVKLQDAAYELKRTYSGGNPYMYGAASQMLSYGTAPKDKFEYEDVDESELGMYKTHNVNRIRDYVAKSKPKMYDSTHYVGASRVRTESIRATVPEYGELLKIEEQRNFVLMLDAFYDYHYSTTVETRSNAQVSRPQALELQVTLERHFNEQVEKLLPHCVNVIGMDPQYALYMIHQVSVAATRAAGSQPYIGLRDVMESEGKINYRLSYDSQKTPQYRLDPRAVAPKVSRTESYQGRLGAISETEYEAMNPKVQPRKLTKGSSILNA